MCHNDDTVGRLMLAGQHQGISGDFVFMLYDMIADDFNKYPWKPYQTARMSHKENETVKEAFKQLMPVSTGLLLVI